MKCPCCKVINSLNECLKHRSVTSAQAATRAWQSFVEMDSETLILAILPCQKHGAEDGFSAFINEANRAKGEIVSRARADRERIAAQNIDRMVRDAASRILGVRLPC